jgi:hypothetical protein
MKWIQAFINWHIDCIRYIDQGGGLYYFGLAILIASLVLNYVYN